MTVAIIMRSMNEQPYVEKVFKALGGQTFQDFALYNVDSGSTDGTWECICRENTRADRRRRIRSDQYVPGKVLNDAIAQAAEPVIVLLNADAVPLSATWLEDLVGPLLRDEADATLSRQVARNDAYFIVKDDYQRAYDPDRYARMPLDLFSAVSCAFKRTLWEKEAFPAEGYAEDWAWFQTCRAQGAKFKLVASSVVEHSHNYSLQALYRKRHRQAKTFARVDRIQPSALKQTLAALQEVGRDLYRASRAMQFHTIPYNIAYRAVIHAAVYRGRREGCVR